MALSVMVVWIVTLVELVMVMVELVRRREGDPLVKSWKAVMIRVEVLETECVVQVMWTVICQPALMLKLAVMRKAVLFERRLEVEVR